MGARSGSANLDRRHGSKRLHIREEFDDLACLDTASAFARRYHCRSFGERSFRPATAGLRAISVCSIDCRARFAARLAADRPSRRQRGRREACAGRFAADPDAGRQAADRPAQAAAQLKLPPGFNIEVYASGIGNARSLRVGNKVTAVVKKDGKTELKTIASGLYRPNGLAYHNGTLYIAELSQISKIDNVEANLDNLPKPTVIYTDLPKDEAHGWKFIAVGPDNKLYVPVGQPGNNVLHDKDHGQIRRMNLDGTGAEVIAVGVRNTVGFDWNPVNKQLYFSDNGRDWMSEDVPQDELNRVTKVGQDFGAPYCYQGNIPDPEFGWGHSCSEFVPPIMLTGPHSAGLGLRFYTGNMFPKKYKNAIFLARHGSWNKSKKFGGDVIAVFLNKDGTVKSSEPFITGFLQDNKYLGRPVDVEIMKDGSMLVSDDWNGAIYRVTYGKARVAGR
jgi:glucose/arabinose dehydrogenase